MKQQEDLHPLTSPHALDRHVQHRRPTRLKRIGVWLARLVAAVGLSLAMVGTGLWVFCTSFLTFSGCSFSRLVPLYYGALVAVAVFCIAIPVLFRALGRVFGKLDG